MMEINGLNQIQNPISLTEKPKKTQDTKLKESVNDFVSILLAKVFKDMYKSIPKSSLTGGGFGDDWFRELLIDEYAKSASEQSFKSLGEIVYKQIAQTQRK